LARSESCCQHPTVATPRASSSQTTLRAALSDLCVHDVSPTLEPGMPIWPMYDSISIHPQLTHAEHGGAANQLVLSEHTGAHVDAPFHFDPDGPSIDQVPVDALLLRPYKKYDLSEDGHGPGDLVGLERLKAAESRGGFTLEAGDVAIVDFGWDRYYPGGSEERDGNWWGRNEPGLSEEACRYLAESQVAAVASDTAACDVAEKDGEIVAGHGHVSEFLPRGILIVEGLKRLATVPSTGLFLALPLKIKGGTGSPLRVVLITD